MKLMTKLSYLVAFILLLTTKIVSAQDFMLENIILIEILSSLIDFKMLYLISLRLFQFFDNFYYNNLLEDIKLFQVFFTMSINYLMFKYASLKVTILFSFK